MSEKSNSQGFVNKGVPSETGKSSTVTPKKINHLSQIINSVFITRTDQDRPILIWHVDGQHTNGFDIHVQLIRLTINHNYPVKVKITSFNGEELLDASDTIRIASSATFTNGKGIAEIKLPVMFEPNELKNIHAISVTITVGSEQTVVCLYLEDENIG